MTFDQTPTNQAVIDPLDLSVSDVTGYRTVDLEGIDGHRNLVGVPLGCACYQERAGAKNASGHHQRFRKDRAKLFHVFHLLKDRQDESIYGESYDFGHPNNL